MPIADASVRPRRLAPLVAALAAGWVSGPALAQPAAPPERPKYKPLRYEEDWSALKGRPSPDPAADPWDSLKYIELDESGETWLSVGGEARVRAEYFENFTFSDADNADDGFGLLRLRLHGDLRVGESFRAFAEGKSALSTDRDMPGGKRTLDVNTLDLQNAFVDVNVPVGEATLTLRPGRQELLFGKQRLVSPLPWANNMRTFEGFRGIVTAGPWRFDGFWTRLVNTQKYEFDDGDSGSDLFGVYAAGKAPFGGKPLDLDLYWLGLDRDSAAFNGESGEESRHTLGARLGGKLGATGLDVDAEGGYQFGELGDADISAFFFASQLGYSWGAETWKPRVWVGFDYASGDDEAGDGEVGTFNQLFPLAHAYHGYIDILGRQNLIDWSLGASCWPGGKLGLAAEGHLFYRASDEDGVYNTGGTAFRPGSAGSDSEIGQELDFTITYKFDAHATLQAGYSIFFAGEFIEESGAAEDASWVYAMLTYQF